MQQIMFLMSNDQKSEKYVEISHYESCHMWKCNWQAIFCFIFWNIFGSYDVSNLKLPVHYITVIWVALILNLKSTTAIYKTVFKCKKHPVYNSSDYV